MTLSFNPSVSRYYAPESHNSREVAAEPADFNRIQERASEIGRELVTTGKKQLSIPERLWKNVVWALAAQQAEMQNGSFDIEIFDREFFVATEVSWDASGQSFSGVASAQGRRAVMEDTHIMADLQIEGAENGAQLFGVFDGHAGAGASAFVKDNVAFYLQREVQAYRELLRPGVESRLTDEVIWNALKQCFIRLSEDYEGEDGTTAVIAFIVDRKVWIANVGDSRAIFVKEDGETIQASEDAKPDIERYRRKIESHKGCVIKMLSGISRVNGFLAVARAVGDHEVTGVIANPKITCYALEDFVGGYVVLACDGLYDVATTNEVGYAVDRLTAQGFSPDEIAQRLVSAAIGNGSKDNVTTLVVKLPAP